MSAWDEFGTAPAAEGAWGEFPTAGEGQDDARVAAVLQTTMRTVPDARAQALLLQKRTGLSLSLVESQLPAIKRSVESVEFDAARLRKTAPGVYDLLSQRPELAPALRDDLEGLSTLEQVIGGMKREWKRGKAIDELAQIGWRQIPLVGGATTEDLVRAETLEQEMEGLPELKLGFVAGIPQAAAQSLPLMLRTMSEAGAATSQGAAVGVAGGAAAGAVAGGVGAVPGAAIGLVTGAGVGLRVGMTVSAGQAEAGLAFREFLKIPGVTPEEAGAAALVVGGVNGALEAFALDKVFRLVPGLKALGGQGTRDLMRRLLGSNTGRAALARLAGRVGQAGLTEGLTEGMQELSTVLGGVALGAPTTFAEGAERVGGAALQGAQGGLGLGAPSATVQLASDVAQVRQAQDRAEFIRGLGEAVSQSKTRERLPSEFKEHVRRVVERYGAVDALSAPAEALQVLFQKEGLSPEFVAEEMPGVARQLEQAATDPAAEVTIPLHEYATHIAPLSGAAALEPDLRVGDGLTLREAEKVEKDAQAVLKEMSAPAKEAKEGEVPDPARAVFDDVVGQLTAAGQAPDVARTNAALWQAFVRSRAERLGQDPAAYYKGLNLTVQQGEVSAPARAAQVEPGAPAAPAKPDRVPVRVALEGDQPTHEVALPKWLDPEEFTGNRTAWDLTWKALKAAGEADPLGADEQAQRFVLRYMAAAVEGFPTTDEFAVKQGLAAARIVMGKGGAAAASLRERVAAWMKAPLAEKGEDPIPEVSWGRMINTDPTKEDALDRAAKAALEGKETPEWYAPAPQTLAQPTARVTVSEEGGKTVLRFPGSPLRLVLSEEGGALKAELLDLGIEETKANQRKVGGQGYSTALYLRALRLAQEKGLGFESDVIRTPATDRMYARLQKLGIPFAEAKRGEFDALAVSAEALKGTDLDQAERLNEAEAEIQRLRGEQPAALGQRAKPGDVRGTIEFGQARDWFRVTLTGKANLSTFLHESGHAFLEILRRDAATDAASARDLATVEAWLGARGAWTEKHLEKFARGFEAYLWEGKAPSEGLAAVFDTVKGWLRWIYATLRGLDVELTDEVRGVMDRLLATDEEIQKARTALSLVPPVAMEGLTPEETQKVRDLWTAGLQAARRDLEMEAMKDARRAIGEEREKVRAEVEKEARSDPAMNAWEVFRGRDRLDGAAVDPAIKGKRLDSVEIDAMHLRSDQVRRVMDPSFKAAPRDATRRLSAVSRVGGLSPDVAAPYLGFASGEEMVRAMVARPSFETWVRQETDRRFAEKYPDLQVASLADKAMAALHSNEMGTAIWAGMVAAGKKIGAAPEKSVRDALRLAAKRRAAEMTDLEMQPQIAQRAEARAAREAAEAWKKGNAAEAYEAQRRQLWNHYLWREVSKARDEVESIRRRMAKYDELSTRQRIGKAGGGHLEAIDAILDGSEFRPVSRRALKRRASLASYLAEMRANGQTVIVPPEIESEAGLRSYREMTLSELRAVDASVRNIEHLARTKNRLFDGRKAREFDATVAQVVETVEKNLGAKPDSDNQNPSVLERTLENARSYDAHLKKMEFIVRMMDGGKTAGPMHELLIQPFADAEAREADLWRTKLAELKTEYQKMGLRERFAHDLKVDFLGKRIARRHVLAIALNVRNEGNFNRLSTAHKWERPAILQRLDEILSDEDVALVNRLGRLSESLWPLIEETYKSATGLAPPKVKGDAVTLPSGRVIEGGYYPIIKDPRRSHLGRTVIERETGELWENGFMTPALAHGFTEARGRDLTSPLLLSLDALPRHLSKVIHYVTHYEAVRAVDRLTQNEDVRRAIVQGLSPEAYQQIRPWLQAIAHDTDIGTEALSVPERVLRHMRMGAGVVLLTLKVSTAVKQLLGLTMTAKEIGRYTLSGAHRFAVELGHGRNPFADIASKSGAFRDFVQNFDRDFRDTYRSMASGLSVVGSARHAVAQFSGALFQLMQGTVNAITWYGAHEKALSEGHERPVDYADSIVRMTQSGGGVKDLAAVQRGGEFKKAWTVLYSWYSVLYNSLTERVPQGQAKVPVYAARFFWAVTLPVVIEGMLSGRYDDEEPEDIAKKVMMDSALFALRSDPFLGSLGAAALQERSPRQAPWIDTMYRAAVSVGKAADEDHEMTDAEERALVDVAGMALKIPTGGLRIGDEWLEGYLSGDLDEPVMDLLFRNKREWR